MHHVDDIRGCGPRAVVDGVMTHLKTKFWIKWDEVEEIGVSGSFLKKSKCRGEGFIETMPNTKHVAKLAELLGLAARNHLGALTHSATAIGWAAPRRRDRPAMW